MSPCRQEAGWGRRDGRGASEGVSPWGLERRLKGINTEERHVAVGHPGAGLHWEEGGHCPFW